VPFLYLGLPTWQYVTGKVGKGVGYCTSRPFSVPWIANLALCDWDGGERCGVLYEVVGDLSFGNLFFNDKPSEANNEKTTVETEAESIVSVIIQQDMFVIPPTTTLIVDLTSRPDSPNVYRPLQATTTKTTTTTIHPPPPQLQQSTTDSMLMKRIGELEHIMANLIQDNKHLEERLDSHGARLYTLENLDVPQQVNKVVDKIVTDVVDWAIQAPLQNRFRDLPEVDMKEILHQRIWETNSYQTHEDHMMLYEALEKSMNRPSKTSGSPGASGSSHVPPPPPPPPSTNQEAHLSDDEDIGNAYIPKVNLRQVWWKPLKEDRPATPEPAWFISSSDVPVPKNNWASALASTYSPPPEDSLLAQTGDMEMFMDRFYKRQGITKLKPQDLEGLAFELVKVFHPNVIHLQYQMEECHKLLTDSMDDSIIRHNVSKPLPLGGPPGLVTIQSDFFFNKDLEYLRYGSKGSRPVLSISKMKAAYYPDVGLEQMVPDQIHTSEGDRRAVRTHIRILSVVRIKVFSMYSDSTLHQIDEALDYRVKEFKVAVCSSLRSPKPKRTIESRSKRSCKIISLGHYSIMLASSHTVKMKMEILLEPTSNKLLVVKCKTWESADGGPIMPGGPKYIRGPPMSAWIASVADNSEYFFGLVTPFSSTVGQRSGPFSTDSRIILPCCLFIMYSSIQLFHESYMSFFNIGGRLSAPKRIALSARVVIVKFVMLKIS
nr:hypothetical protein [Tanacetum cinerariifolium]